MGRPVQFVDKDDYRGFAHPAHLHKLAGLGLNPFGGIYDDNDTVARCQGTERIFSEVLVTGGI